MSIISLGYNAHRSHSTQTHLKDNCAQNNLLLQRHSPHYITANQLDGVYRQTAELYPIRPIYGQSGKIGLEKCKIPRISNTVY